MILPYTSQALLTAGYNPQPLQRAANDSFMAVGTHERGHMEQGAIYASNETTEHFWQVFCAAHRVLQDREAA